MRFSWLVLSALIAGGLWGGQVALGQGAGYTPRKDATEIPSYEVVSIHKTKDGNTKLDYHDDPDGYTAEASTLRRLIAEAYGFSIGELNDQELVGGPEWMKTQLFDVHAKVDPSNVEKLKALEKAETMLVSVQEMTSRTPSYRMLMLQRLLEDRFRVKVHFEQRVMSVYEMTVAKGGLKIKAAHPKDPEHGSLEWSDGKPTTLKSDNVPIAFIPMMLGLMPEIERPVLDKTGVSGDFDFELKFARAGDTESENAGLFTAMQEQLGLKLVPGKGPIWVIVVDHAEMPSEN